MRLRFAICELRLLLALAVLALPAAAFAADPAPAVQPQADTVVVDEKTEAVIKGALKFLSRRQKPNGSWIDGGEAAQHPVAITGYTLMAFLATGNLPSEGEYAKNVDQGVQYLLDHVGSDGFISTPGSNMYGHGIATIVLGEIYGQTHDPKLRPSLEKAVQLIISCQNNQGGWRYAPRMADADISVSVLQVVALRAAKNAGIDVPQPTLDKAVAFVRSCYDKNSGGFTYQPMNHGPGFSRSAAGVYGLQVCGFYDDPMVLSGSQYLLHYGDIGHEWYTYGQFYAAPAQYMIGGDTWKEWYAKQNNLLLTHVKQNGDMSYWDPLDGRVGQVYATCVYTTILAMPYHYIPLYQR